MTENAQHGRTAWYLSVNASDRVADAIFYGALGYLVVEATTSAWSAAAVMAIASAPRALTLLPGGAKADKEGLVRVTSWTLTARLIILLVMSTLLTVTTGHTYVGVIVVVSAALFGLLDGLHLPAVDGMQRLLAEGRQLQQLRGRTQAVGLAVSTAATPLGAVLAASAWPSAAPALAAGALVVAATSLRFGPRAERPAARSDQTMSAAMLEGLAAAWGDPRLRRPLILLVAANLTTTAPILLGLPLKSAADHWSSWQLGVALGGWTLGSGLGAWQVSRVDEQIPFRRVLLLAGPGLFALAALSLSSSWLIVLITVMLCGASFSAAFVVTVTTLMTATAPELAGRMQSLVTLTAAAGVPVGYCAYAGLVALGVPLAGVMCAASLGLVIVLVTRPVKLSQRAAQTARVK